MRNLSERSQSGLAAILDTALDAVVVMRLDGTVAAWNRKAEQTFGWSSAEAHGLRMSELIIPHRYRDAHQRGLSNFRQTGEGPVLNRHIEITAVHRNGREIPVELSITLAEQFDEPVFLGFIRDITERRDAELRQQRMVRELSHRVKNMLAIVAAIAQQTARASSSTEEFQDAYMGRLHSLARAHDLLVGGECESTSLRALVEELLKLAGAGDQVEYGGPEVLLSPAQLLGLSMIFHELLTNAMKYGALRAAGGAVSLRWSVGSDGRTAEAIWKESGAAHVEPPVRIGFGHKMIAMSTKHDLRGEHETEWQADGVRLTIRFPLDEREPSTE